MKDLKCVFDCSEAQEKLSDFTEGLKCITILQRYVSCTTCLEIELEDTFSSVPLSAEPETLESFHIIVSSFVICFWFLIMLF